MMSNQIVVRLPNTLRELVYSFPFIENLKHFYEIAQLHLIVDKELAPYLVLLPFNAYIHVFDKAEYPGVLDITRFASHQENLTDVEKFFSLTDSKVDAALGKAFNAKEKIGFKFGISANLLFDIKINPDSKNLKDKYLKLLSGNIKKDAKYFSRELTQLVPEENRNYVVINIDYQEDRMRLDPRWCDYIDYYQGQNIFIMSENAPQDKMKELVDIYKINSGQENKLLPFIDKDTLSKCQLLYHAKGFITSTSDLTYCTSYMGVPTIEFTDENKDASCINKVYQKFSLDSYKANTAFDESFKQFNL